MHSQVIYAPAFQKPSGRLYLGTSQLNLTSGNYTPVELDTVTSGFVDGIENLISHKITPGKAGLYLIKGQVYYTNLIADKSYEAFIDIDGTLVSYVRVHASCTDNLAAKISTIKYLSNVNDVKLFAKSNAGVNTVDILQGDFYTFLEVQRVR